MQDLTNQAGLLLPGAAGSQEEASQPLKQRLAEAWKGKVPQKPSIQNQILGYPRNPQFNTRSLPLG